MSSARWTWGLLALSALLLGAAAEGDDEPNFVFSVEGNTRFWRVPAQVVYGEAPEKIVTSFAEAAGCLVAVDPGDCFDQLAADADANADGGAVAPLAYLILNPNDWSRWYLSPNPTGVGGNVVELDVVLDGNGRYTAVGTATGSGARFGIEGKVKWEGGPGGDGILDPKKVKGDVWALNEDSGFRLSGNLAALTQLSP